MIDGIPGRNALTVGRIPPLGLFSPVEDVRELSSGLLERMPLLGKEKIELCSGLVLGGSNREGFLRARWPGIGDGSRPSSELGNL